MKEISHQEVLRIAHLARLHLEESQLSEVATELARILEAFSALQSAQLEPADLPLATPPATNRRPDRVQASLPRDRALGSAPEVAHGHIRIPRVMSLKDE